MSRKRTAPLTDKYEGGEEGTLYEEDDMFAGASSGPATMPGNDDGTGRVSEEEEEEEPLLPSSKRTGTFIKDDYSTASEPEEDDEAKDFSATGTTERELRAWARSEIPDASLIHRENSRLSESGDVDEPEPSIPIEPFSMDAELAEGRIDEVTGDYVCTSGRGRRDDLEEHELGLVGLSKETMARTRQAAAERRRREDSQVASAAPASKRALIEQLLPYLSLGETPVEALARRRPPRRLPLRKGQQERDRMENVETAAGVEKQRKWEVGLITDVCTNLLTEGLLDVYELTREELGRMS